MTQTQEIYSTDELGELCVTFQFTFKKITSECRDTREAYTRDLDTLAWMSACYATSKLQASIKAHHDFMRSAEWKYGSDCFDWGVYHISQLRMKLCIDLVRIVALGSKEKTKHDLMCVEKALTDLSDHHVMYK